MFDHEIFSGHAHRKVDQTANFVFHFAENDDLSGRNADSNEFILNESSCSEKETTQVHLILRPRLKLFAACFLKTLLGSKKQFALVRV